MRFPRLLALWLLMPVMVVTFSGCERDPGTVVTTNTTLVGSTEIASLSRAQLTDRVAALGLNVGQIGAAISLIIQRDIKAYRITYRTKNTDGASIVASGAIIVPTAISGDEFAIISQQHGTIFDDSQAPSYFGPASEAATAGALLASAPYIVVCPDYIGFGESKNVPHPYIHRQSQASASLDMLRAAREFIREKGIRWNNRVFLTGYSQGGHATMSLLKMMEEQFPTEFTLTAATCGAGPYNVEGFMKELINNPSHGNAAYNNLYIGVLQTYNRVYNLNRPMSFYFKAPYAADVQANGNRSNVNVSFNTALTDEFRNGINSGSDVSMLTAIRDNNVYDWKPNTPLLLVHGTADQQVFYKNSTDAETAMKARGATNVRLEPIPGKDHGPAIQDFILNTYGFFNPRRGY